MKILFYLFFALIISICFASDQYSELQQHLDSISTQTLNPSYHFEHIDEIDTNGNTPLIASIKAHEFQLSKLLIIQGADVNLVDSNGDTPLILAAKFGFYYTTQELLAVKSIELDKKNKHSMTALLMSISGGHDLISQALIFAGANPNLSNEFGISPLTMASQTNLVPTIEFLVKHGSFIEMPTVTGETAIMYAAISAANDAIKTLVQHHAKINAQNNNGMTALMFAVARQHFSTVQLLISLGADMDQQDFSGDAAIHFAFNVNNLPIMHELLASGAEIPHFIMKRLTMTPELREERQAALERLSTISREKVIEAHTFGDF